MPWTYSGDPASSAKDEVRFLVGDTNTADQLVQDEEINYVLLAHADAGSASINYRAAAEIAEAIAAKFARKADKAVGPLSIQAKQQHDHYVQLAGRLRKLAFTGGSIAAFGTPVLGGGGQTYLGGKWA